MSDTIFHTRALAKSKTRIQTVLLVNSPFLVAHLMLDVQALVFCRLQPGMGFQEQGLAYMRCSVL